MQQYLAKQKIKYSYGPFNTIAKDDTNIQVIRLSEGCPNNCPYCYEQQQIKLYDIPKITRNRVRIIDMNLLCKPEAIDIINKLGNKRVNNKVVRYNLVCGVDYRYMTQKIANALKQNRFTNIRLAWDFGYQHQKEIKKAITFLLKAGYVSRDITIFMICNWKIPFSENILKLDLCKVWNIKVADCYFDNQLSPNIIPIHWKSDHIKEFRHKVRKHNQLINFSLDPEVI